MQSLYRVTKLFAACFLATVAITGSAPSNAENQTSKAPIRIGFITTLTGAGSDSGQEMLQGITTYLEDVHHQMAGRPVELVIGNDGGNPATAMTIVTDWANNNTVDVITGLLLSNVAYKVAPIAAKAHIPLVDAVAAADDLTQRQHSPWLVRTGSTCSQSFNPLADYAYRKLGYRRVITFAADYAFGWEAVGGFQRSFEEEGGKIVQKVWWPLGFLNFESMIKSIRHDADAVLLITVHKPALIIPKQYKQFGPGLPVMASAASFDENILPKLGDEALGAVTPTNYASRLDSPANKRFVQNYRRSYHIDPGLFAERCYAAAMWIDKATQTLHGDVKNKTEFMTALRNVGLTDAPRGEIKLDEFGNAIDTIYIQKVVRKDGRLANETIDVYPNVSPFWHWKPQEYMKQPPYSRDYPPCKYCN